MPTAEEYRERAIADLARALASRSGVSGPSLAQAAAVFRPAAEAIVDHITAHAVETVRDLVKAERGVQWKGGF